MAQNTDITLTAGAWTQLTNADAAGDITFQNKTGDAIWIKATVDATPPTTFDGSIRYENGDGEKVQTIAELFPGLTTPDRLWAWSHNGGKVAVSHA
jgi:hypothetical protein